DQPLGAPPACPGEVAHSRDVGLRAPCLRSQLAPKPPGALLLRVGLALPSLVSLLPAERCPHTRAAHCQPRRLQSLPSEPSPAHANARISQCLPTGTALWKAARPFPRRPECPEPPRGCSERLRGWLQAGTPPAVTAPLPNLTLLSPPRPSASSILTSLRPKGSPCWLLTR
uniref:Uncharacterized protein n=1 Tax=Anas platyrhynchos platyrhynchos TaxID=8840 RepID=A0A493T959_ANAPP